MSCFVSTDYFYVNDYSGRRELSVSGLSLEFSVKESVTSVSLF
jgi:hypothetical protein